MRKLNIKQALLVSFLLVVALSGIAAYVIISFVSKIWLNSSLLLFIISLLLPVLFFLFFSILARKWKFLGISFLIYFSISLSIALSFYLYYLTETHIASSLSFHNGLPISEEQCIERGEVWTDGKCFYKCGENEIQTIDGFCELCPENSSLFNILEEECLKCDNGEMLNDRCVPKKCLGAKLPLRDKIGYCHPCDTTSYINFSKEDCDRCENREMKDGFCVFRNGISEKRKDGRLWKTPYVNGVQHGTIEIYSPAGWLFQTTPKQEGTVEGLSKTYNSKGDVVSITPYIDEKKQGVQEYYPRHDGKSGVQFGYKQTMDYSNDEREGLYRVYFENGNIKQEQEFKDDKENGYDRLYDETGALLLESEFKDGKMIKVFCYTSSGEKRALLGAAFINYANGGIDYTCNE